MTDSFAGIAVPSGSVGELHSSASRLSDQARVLADASQRLSGMPSAASSWIGPAHSAYAGRCIRASTAAGLAAQSFTMAAGAAEAYAGELEKAQHKARRAIDDARRAQKTIDHAKHEISLAQGRQRSAQTRIDAAQHAVAVAAMAPGADTGAAAALLHAFLPGHHAPIIDPSPEQFPGARPITADDLHLGLSTGAGAVAATPGRQP